MADAEAPIDTANRLIAYHAPISRALTQERTSLESALIPVTAYIVVACAESYLRYPEMMERIDAAMPAEEVGRRARRPGCQVDPCYLWSIANFFLLGRKIMAMVDPQGDDPAAHRAPSSTSGSAPRSRTGATAPARRGTPAPRASTTPTPSPPCSTAPSRSPTTNTGRA